MKIIEFEGSELAAFMFLQSVLGQHWFQFLEAYRRSGEDLFTFTQMGEGEALLKAQGIDFTWWC